MTNIKKNKTVFIVMDFDPVFNEVYRLIKDVVKNVKIASITLNCIRANELIIAGTIPDKINSLMKNCDFFIADISSFNSNVFYEIGYLKACGMPGLIIHRGKLPTSKSKTKKLPIYILTDDTITYYQEHERKLKKEIKLILLKQFEQEGDKNLN